MMQQLKCNHEKNIVRIYNYCWLDENSSQNKIMHQFDT